MFLLKQSTKRWSAVESNQSISIYFLNPVRSGIIYKAQKKNPVFIISL